MNKKKRKGKRSLVEDLKMFHGYPPYHEGSNIVVGDGFFAKSLLRVYGAATIEELEKRIGFEKYHRAWGGALREFHRLEREKR